MKNFTLLFTAFLMSFAMLAQEPASPIGGPQGINYQTVIRDGAGNILPDTEISLQMTIRSGAPDGEVVYQETHNATTNAFGLVNLVIGNGTPQSGSFAGIAWGKNSHYLQTAIDTTGSETYTVLGTTQFLSVPYANFSGAAGGILTMTTQERNALQNPPVGMQIYNSTTNCLNYFNGTSWFETCGNCTPMPTQANAGPNQYFDNETVATNLEGNTPEFGTGTWNVVSGVGGSFDDANDPTTLFTGQACETYSLKWNIENPCGSTSDNVIIQFDTQPTTADAGEDQLYLDNTTSITLEGNTPQMGEGLWSIQSGQGGSLDDPTDPNTVFTGSQCETYVLRWTISTPCDTSWDEVVIQFDATPTIADAGDDQSYTDNTTTVILEGNTPEVGEGTWSVVNGTGGSFDDATDPNTEFSGQQCQTYTLKWIISTTCHESSDEVIVEFNNTPTVASAGPDQLYVQGTSTNLEGNTPENGLGYWSIVSGSGGTIQLPTNPASVFTGQQGEMYELKWTISTECNSYSDNVNILFSDFECGQPLTDYRDNRQYETVQIDDQCWMAENLAYLPAINPSSQGNNTDPYYYVYGYQGASVKEAKATANYQTYGVLYNWPASLNVCPEGWHLPSDAEWTILTDYVSSQPEYNCNDNTDYIAKALAATTNWSSSSSTCAVGNNLAVNNASGFTALPGGFRYTDGNFINIGDGGYWWSSTEDSSISAWCRGMTYGNADVERYDGTRGWGYGVRCLRD